MNDNFHNKNNLNINLRKALNELKTEIDNKKIVLCKSDKDGKVILLNYNDYDTIMKRELNKFECLDIPDYKIKANEIRSHTESLVINLHQHELIDDELLFHTVGVKFHEISQKYSRIKGPSAKYFLCQKPAYAYPLVKTHKIDAMELSQTPILDIPVRLLQSAGNITTSRVTTLLEHILQPISV